MDEETKDLTQQINRLREINEEHRRMNGALRAELARLKSTKGEDNV